MLIDVTQNVVTLPLTKAPFGLRLPGPRTQNERIHRIKNRLRLNLGIVKIAVRDSPDQVIEQKPTSRGGIEFSGHLIQRRERAVTEQPRGHGQRDFVQ